MSEAAFPIDVVISWVDGDDPAWRERRKRYLPEGADKHDDIAGDTRYRSVGEIDYCVASIRRFAPWVRTTYIVTDRQTPNLQFSPISSVKIVDHTILFAGYEKYLPTFNSRAIETMMWRIPELSEHFIYFNDDIVLTRPVEPSEFFEDGKSVCYARWFSIFAARLIHAVKPKHGGHKPVGFKDSLVRAASIVGEKRRFLYLSHSPHTIRRSVLEDYYSAHPDVLERNIRYRFRDGEQFNAQELYYLLARRKGLLRLAPVKGNVLYLKPRKGGEYVARKLQRFDNETQAFCCCFNSLDQASEADRQRVKGWLDKKIILA
ncbi:MAG: Stealth CR1 domain-containing protein [Bacteroidaceae bacterium]|nr:Stealth CR1 domain-containing protein [Bacteroidaceae bacterium]